MARLILCKLFGSSSGPTKRCGLIWTQTDGNKKFMLSWHVLVLFQSTTANKNDFEHTRDYTKLFPVCKVEILQVTVNKIEFLNITSYSK